MNLYRSTVLVCGGTGCTSSGSHNILERFETLIRENGLENEDMVVLGAGNAAQKQIFLAQRPRPAPDGYRLFQGRAERFRPRRDQKGIQAHLSGQGMGNHISDHHAVAALFQPLQDLGRIFGAVNGQNIDVIAQQVTQDVGRFCNAGEAHNGIAVRVVSCQLDGPQHIIDRKLDFYHRNIGYPADQLGCTAAGDNAVIDSRRELLDDARPSLQITGPDIQMEVGKGLRLTLHGQLHAFIGGNSQDMGLILCHTIHTLSKTALIVLNCNISSPKQQEVCL